MSTTTRRMSIAVYVIHAILLLQCGIVAIYSYCFYCSVHFAHPKPSKLFDIRGILKNLSVSSETESK